MDLVTCIYIFMEILHIYNQNNQNKRHYQFESEEIRKKLKGGSLEVPGKRQRKGKKCNYICVILYIHI